ncbi:hypothetical protein L208DRAFT_1406855 [Tricholoma matsutake]|nr:hypothetical protein L208DRAFT_1406855 [Tricholoma matsutake 945]
MTDPQLQTHKGISNILQYPGKWLKKPFSRPHSWSNSPQPSDSGHLVCNDPGCETLVSNVDLLRCDSPGCYLVYHLTCHGLIEKPSGGWFCDDECKRNVGFRVGGCKCH